MEPKIKYLFSSCINNNKTLNSTQINIITELLYEQSVSFVQLQEVANQITQVYRKHGSSNLKAIIQKQNLDDGIIETYIIEDRNLCNANSDSCSILRLMWQEAVEAQNWNHAIEIVDKLIQSSPQEASQLKEYRTQLQNRLTKTPTSTTQKPPLTQTLVSTLNSDHPLEAQKFAQTDSYMFGKIINGNLVLIKLQLMANFYSNKLNSVEPNSYYPTKPYPLYAYNNLC
jgi:hypothetical protein